MRQETKRFVGRLQRGEKHFPVEFNVSAGEDFRLQLEVLPTTTQTAFDLQSAMGKPGSIAESLTLEGNSDSGETFFSDTVDVFQASLGSSESLVGLSVRAAKISGPLEIPAPLPSMRLWFRGFKSFRNTPVSSALGQVEVRGASKKVGRDEASGYVAIHAEAKNDLSDWPNRADELLTFMHRGLGFASGKRLQTPGLELQVGERWERTYYEGDGFGSGLAPIHFMDQSPFVETLVRRFEKPTPFPEMLWTVVGWLHVEIPFDEARFLMAMTALETICEHVLPKSRTTLMDKKDYRPLRERLIAIVADAKLEPSIEEVLTQRIRLANGRTFFEKLRGLRDHYALSPDVFADSEIADLVRLRNNLVHTGQGGGRRRAWPKILFIREMLSQVIFQELGYVGPHESYLQGYKRIAPPRS